MFIWLDCPSGEWRLKTAAAGGSITYTGTVTSSANYSSVKPSGLSANDVLNFTSNPKQIAFTFRTSGTSTDGVNFIPNAGASNCLSITTPATNKVYFGPFRTPLAPPFELDTQGNCP